MIPTVEAINTVGCGDSVIAGFAVGFSRGMPVIEIMKFASAISAANAMRIETGFYLTKDMEELLPQIHVVKIK
jgi:tagatose 6-phosphate kinase